MIKWGGSGQKQSSSPVHEQKDEKHRRSRYRYGFKTDFFGINQPNFIITKPHS